MYMTDEKIRVLIADDSLFMRRMLRQMLSGDSRIEVVDEAADGVEAVAKCISLSPDVLVLDVEMPKLDGISVLKNIMSNRPLPVVMFSSLTQRGSQVTLEALSMGAVDFVPKPASRDGVTSVASELCQKVIQASKAKLRIGEPMRRHEKERAKRRKSSTGEETLESLVVIGSSTGGPQALEEIVSHLLPDLSCGIVICQHMPKGFTTSFAQRLDSLSSLTVRESEQEDVLEPGVALVARGGYHLRLDSSIIDGRQSFHVYLDEGTPVHGVRPSVDITLFDAVSLFGSNLMVVILTGMGFDGAKGAWAAKQKGATVICQDQETSVVWGMPKACYETGATDVLVPITRIAGMINEFGGHQSKRSLGQ